MLADLEPELYSQLMGRAQGNLTKAAEWLGVARLKMREKLKEFGLYEGGKSESNGSGTARPVLPLLGTRCCF